MPKWSEHDMDKLFQIGSERYDFEYNPEAWEQMNQLLSQQERRRRALWWIWGAGLIALLAVLSLFLFFKKNTLPAPSSTSIDTPILDDQESNPEISTLPSDPKPEKNNQENGLGETIQQEQALPNVPGNGEEQGIRPLQKSSTQIEASDQSQQSKAAEEESPPSTPIAESGIGEKGGSEPDLAADAEGDKIVELQYKEDNALTKPSEQAAPLQVLPNHLPLLTIPFFPNENAPPSLDPSLSDFDDKKINPNRNRNAFLIGLTGASEFNSVGFGDFTERNWKYGFQLEYRFKRRWSVRAGASFIKMWYDAGYGEYEPGGNFWVDGIAPKSTRGQCNMWEIPLHLSYHFKGYQNNGFFAVAGVASYIITEEHYWYKYYNPPPDPIFYWGTFDHERNWLNIGHLSFGYNYNISRKFSAQIGPFLQLPLSGVGHGHVKIFSAGVNAAINFKVK